MTDWIVPLAAGVGLAAASGFRVFVPLFGVSLAMRLADYQPAAGFEWLADPVATFALGAAVAVEVGAYLVPWLDNALDTIATPLAVVAGTMLTALMLGDASPGLQWILAVVAGGGTAGAVQMGTVALRAGSLVTTGGLANPLVALGEAGLSGLFTILALVVPLTTVVLLVVVVLWWRHRRQRRQVLLVLVAAFGLTACAGNPPPGDGDGPETEPAPTAAEAAEVDVDKDVDAGEGVAAALTGYGIPPEHLPPPGQCRIWMPEEPPEQQARENPVGRCSALRGTIPAGGWLVYRPTDDSGVVRVWQYGEGGRVLHQRIYDVETGELLRHVGPMGH